MNLGHSVHTDARKQRPLSFPVSISPGGAEKPEIRLRLMRKGLHTPLVIPSTWNPADRTRRVERELSMCWGGWGGLRQTSCCSAALRHQLKVGRCTFALPQCTFGLHERRRRTGTDGTLGRNLIRFWTFEPRLITN